MGHPGPISNSRLALGGEFGTRKLQLAAYLHDSSQLRYLRCEVIDHVRGNVRFVFADPSNAGPDLELSFENNNAAINAKSLFASQTFLRQQMMRTIENGDTTSDLAHARR